MSTGSCCDGSSEVSRIRLIVDGTAWEVQPGRTVAAALLERRVYTFRKSPGNRGPRGPLCLMGACQECAIRIDGAIRRACQVEVRQGMQVQLCGAGMGADAELLRSPATQSGDEA